MSKESTNVELEPITVIGGEIVTDIDQQKTQIPPEGILQIDSPENEEVIRLNLSGEWPPREKTESKKETTKKEKGSTTTKKTTVTATGKKTTTTTATGKKAAGSGKKAADIDTER